MDGIPYADIIILALIAGFILLRLRSVLGQKTGNDNPQFFKREEAAATKEAVVQVAGKPAKPEMPADPYLLSIEDKAVVAVLEDIKKRDGQFTATSFIQGARMAYEMVFDAFAKGDKKALEMLLDRPIYDTFNHEIEIRNAAKEKLELTLVAVKVKTILNASLIGTKARITVKFDSEQVALTKDEHGTIVGGNPSQTVLMDDEWVFEREVTFQKS